jgi:hypothetical protein
MPQDAGAGVSTLLTDELCPRAGHAVTLRKPAGGALIIALPRWEGKRVARWLALPAQDRSVTFGPGRPLIFSRESRIESSCALFQGGQPWKPDLARETLATRSSVSALRSLILHGGEAQWAREASRRTHSSVDLSLWEGRAMGQKGDPGPAGQESLRRILRHRPPESMYSLGTQGGQPCWDLR